MYRGDNYKAKHIVGIQSFKKRMAERIDLKYRSSVALNASGNAIGDKWNVHSVALDTMDFLVLLRALDVYPDYFHKVTPEIDIVDYVLRHTAP